MYRLDELEFTSAWFIGVVETTVSVRPSKEANRLNCVHFGLSLATFFS